MVFISAHMNKANRFNHEPERTRKLLMHKSEINKLHAQVKEKRILFSAA